MQKRALIADGTTLLIVMALFLIGLAGCTLGSDVPRPGSAESTQGTSGDGSSVPQASATETPESSPAPAGVSALTLTIPAGVVLQHGDLAVSGTGFQPGEEVAISARLGESDSNTLIARITADDQGTITENTGVPVPDWLTSGIHTLIAKGEKSGFEVETPLYVRSDKLWVEVGNYGVRPTDKLGFVAGGFQPGETIGVYLEGLSGSPIIEIVADGAGNIPWTEIDVPVLAGGNRTLSLRGQTSREEVSAVISVVPVTPWIELVPFAGRPGSQVKLHGRGFVPGEEIRVTFGRYEELATTFTADEFGNFFDQAVTTIPLDARGERLEVQVAGQTSQVTVTQYFSVLPVEPWIGLDVYSGPPGTTVRFRGLGYAAGEMVTIHMSDRNSTPVASGRTDEEGSFGWIGMVTIPATANRDVTFYGVGESSRVEATVTFSTIIIPTPVPPPPIQPPQAR